jgi:hypothetical protein
MAKATQYDKGFRDGIEATKKFLKAEALRLLDLRKISGAQMTALVNAASFLESQTIPTPKPTRSKVGDLDPIQDHPERD